jgi:calcineurin-like phosphoesterase family protein
MAARKSWFMADPHLGHQRVLEFSGRRFPTIQDHDAYILDRINSLVNPRDDFYILGDLTFLNPDVYLRHVRNKRLKFIVGNHDRRSKWRGIGYDTLEISINGVKVFLSHYPNCYWPSSHYGSYHFYGHLHRMRESHLDQLFPGRRSIDVGVDNAKFLLGDYRPFEWPELDDILKVRPGHDHVEWYKQWAEENLCHD